MGCQKAGQATNPVKQDCEGSKNKLKIIKA
jgi:hypothetical protein